MMRQLPFSCPEAVTRILEWCWNVVMKNISTVCISTDNLSKTTGMMIISESPGVGEWCWDWQWKLFSHTAIVPQLLMHHSLCSANVQSWMGNTRSTYSSVCACTIVIHIRNANRLLNSADHVWGSIPVGTMRNEVNSMPRGVAEVVNAHGGHTNCWWKGSALV